MSPDRSPSSRRVRLLALGLVLSLGAAACGSSEESSVTPTLAVPADSSAPTDSSPAGDDDGAPTDDGAANGDGAVENGDADADADEPAPDPVENLFPDIDVLNVADGGTVNLASTLISADQPTLLWFWAPH